MTNQYDVTEDERRDEPRCRRCQAVYVDSDDSLCFACDAEDERDAAAEREQETRDDADRYRFEEEGPDAA